MDQTHGGNGPGERSDEPWVAILANPYSGSRRNPARVRRLTAALERRGLRARPIWKPGDLEAMQQTPAGWAGCRCLVAAGGDGTVSLAINLRLPIPLAVLPLGTENLFARRFSFTLDTEALADRIAAGRTATLDLGRCGGCWFSVVASAGFDAEVIHRMTRWRQRHKGLRRVRRASYAWPITAGLLGYRHPMLELETDDGRRVRGAQAVVANLPEYAMHLNPCPGACGTDGLLDWVVFERPGSLRLALYGLAALRNRHLSRPDVRHGRARRIELRCEAERPVPMEIDGEMAGEVTETAPARFEVHPAAQRIVAAPGEDEAG